MNFLNRAIKNVTRKWSKSLLLVLTFFVIGNFVIIGLGVASATENAKLLTRQKMRAVVSYAVDYNSVWEYGDSIEDEDEREEFYNHYPSVKVNDIKELMKDERIKAANALTSSMMYAAEGVDFVHLNNEAENNLVSSGCYFEADGSQVCEEYVEPSFFVKGNFFDNMIELIDGDFTITEGRFYSQEEIDSAKNVCLITGELAKVNGLKVGDTIGFYLASPQELGYIETATKEDIYSEFEIIGLFESVQQITPDNPQYDWIYPYENPNNTVLMPATSYYLSQLSYAQKSFDYYAAQYPDEVYYTMENRPTEESILSESISECTLLLNDPLQVDQFVEDYADSVPQFLKLSANNEEFDRLAKPLDTLNLYANFIIWLVVINAVVIITLVTALTLKTREYEIGVLLSIGASKFKVVAQFFVELAIVAVLGFTLAIASGSLIASKVGERVLEYQIQESEVENDDDYYVDDDYYYIWDTDYNTKVSLDDLLSEYKVSVSPVIIGEIYVLGLGIVFVSIIIPSLMIMRFNPKRILMNQY